ncbi:MAG: hypothetical protein KC652_09315 [Cyanobacteria bacterium HKST-UBA01]|nr:hypothetical protein [Cyanobacteria bacterium HKST-UBA01]
MDPLGLYQIADQLATLLVPGVRERMHRPRFLTTMAVGAVVTEEMETNPEQPEAPPFMIWEWLVVEALMRTMGDDGSLKNVPGSLVTKRALLQQGYLHHRSYLKTPRIFGFHGVYKRLAIHLGILDVHLTPSVNCHQLVDEWARDAGYRSIDDTRSLRSKWRSAIERSMSQRPSSTRVNFKANDWYELARLTAPHEVGRLEKQRLRKLLLSKDDHSLGAFSEIWNLQEQFTDASYCEEELHQILKAKVIEYTSLLNAIQNYELFSRALQDSFDILRVDASASETFGLDLKMFSSNPLFIESLQKLDSKAAAARKALLELDTKLVTQFDERFETFARSMSHHEYAITICDHHEMIQKEKGIEGKRPWLDRPSRDRVFIRHRYRTNPHQIEPLQYLHSYRGWPIREFYSDLR